MAMITQLSTWAWIPLCARGQSASSLPVPQLDWRPDLPSALIGLGTGLVLALVLRVLWLRIGAARAALPGRVTRVRTRLSRRSEDRYRDQLAERMERSHMLHRHAPLSEMYVPSPLVVPHAVSPVLERLAGEEGGARWREVRLHEAMHPSAVVTTLGEAMRQHTRLAFLGSAGSGRTVLLSYLALLFARRHGSQLSHPEAQRGDTPDVRSGRKREQERLPVVVPLERLDLALAEENGRHALLQPILDAVPGPAVSLVRSRIAAGTSLLLFDNLDLLGAKGHDAALAWIGDLARAYPGNVLAVAGAVAGYGALREIGFAPLVLEGWSAREVTRFARRCERVSGPVPQGADGQEGSEPGQAQAEDGFVPEHGAPSTLLDAWPGARRERVVPIHLALAALLSREGRSVPADPAGLFAQVVLCALERTSDHGLTPPQWVRILSDAAWSMEAAGRHTVERATLERAVHDLLEGRHLASVNAGSETSSAGDGPDLTAQARAAVQALLDAGDLLAHGRPEWATFAHPGFRAYLAAMYAARIDQSPILVAHIRDPLWQDLIGFYAALADVTPLARARLQGVDDIFHANLFAAAGFLAASQKADRQLRETVLAQLGQILLSPSEPAQLRRRAAQALAGFGDRGVLLLFGQAMQHQDPQVRCMGVQGLALLGGERALAGLRHALRDADRLPRIEALYGLASWGGEVALEALILGLQDAHELARQVAAELLATIEGEGQDLLRQAAETDDMYIRRAAMFGLARLGEPWALRIVDRTRREDDEWFVRSAATEVIERMHDAVPQVAPDPAGLETMDWLVTWATSNGVACASLADARQALVRALQQGNQRIKVAAADALGAHGAEDAIPALRAALRDERILVCEASFSALRGIGRRTGARITA